MRASGVRLSILTLAMLAVVPAAAADLPVKTRSLPPASPPPLDTVWSGFYLSLHGGVGLLGDTSLDYVNGAAPNRNVSFNPGWTVLGAAGYRVSPWWRTEIEFGGRGNGVGNISPGTGPSGSVQTNALMFNGYLDFPIQGPVTPYVGAGFGKAWVSHSLTVDGATLTPGGNTSWPWAWQVMAGANVPIAQRWTVGAEYRFLSTQRGLFQDANGLFYNADYNNHSFLIGLTWRPL
jgi:opacity protein-like surface antigen